MTSLTSNKFLIQKEYDLTEAELENSPQAIEKDETGKPELCFSEMSKEWDEEFPDWYQMEMDPFDEYGRLKVDEDQKEQQEYDEILSDLSKLRRENSDGLQCKSLSMASSPGLGETTVEEGVNEPIFIKTVNPRSTNTRSDLFFHPPFTTKTPTLEVINVCKYYEKTILDMKMVIQQLENDCCKAKKDEKYHMLGARRTNQIVKEEIEACQEAMRTIRDERDKLQQLWDEKTENQEQDLGKLEDIFEKSPNLFSIPTNPHSSKWHS